MQPILNLYHQPDTCVFKLVLAKTIISSVCVNLRRPWISFCANVLFVTKYNFYAC